MKGLIKVTKTDSAVVASIESRQKGDGKFWCRKFKDYGSEYAYNYDTEFLKGEWTKYTLSTGVYELCRTIEKAGKVEQQDRFYLFVDKDLKYRFFHKREELKGYIDKIKENAKQESSDEEEIPF